MARLPVKGVVLFSLINYAYVSYLDYRFPLWSELFGWFLSLSSMLCVPGYAAYKWAVTPGSGRAVSPQRPECSLLWCHTTVVVLQKVKALFRPDYKIADIREGGTHDTFDNAKAKEDKYVPPTEQFRNTTV